MIIKYKGFSTFEYQRNKSFRLNDIELVKMDILQHIFTAHGERVMMPKFGTIIPELLFEPLDEETVSLLKDELNTVFKFDPRVELLDMKVRTDIDSNSVTVNVKLLFIEFDIIDNMDLNIQFED